jgi:predicted nucleotidyltransferase
MGIDEGLVREIISRVLSVARPDRIIVFGSAATDSMSPDSDVDLLVLERVQPDVRSESVRIRRSLRGLGMPFDVIVMTTQRFEETKDIIGGVAYPAQKYGRAIYEAA